MDVLPFRRGQLERNMRVRSVPQPHEYVRPPRHGGVNGVAREVFTEDAVARITGDAPDDITRIDIFKIYRYFFFKKTPIS